MPTFEFTGPDGKTYEVDGPEGSSPEQAFGVLQQHLGVPRQQSGQSQPEAQAVTPLISVPHQGFGTQVSRALAGDTARVPVQSKNDLPLGLSLGNAAIGAASGIPGAPGDIEALGRLALSPLSVSQQTFMPTGSDVGNAVFGKASSPAQENIRGLGSFASPFLAKTLLSGGAKVAGAVAKPLLGVTAGVGETPIAEAYKAGKAGGQASAAFLDAMRGNTPVEDVVQKAKDAVAQLKADRSAAYQAGMNSTIKGDPKALDFAPIDAALQKTADIGLNRTGTIETIPGARAVHQKISEVVNQWRSNPTLRTADDFDELKQAINNLQFDGELRTLAGPGTPGSKIVREARNAISEVITSNFPGYAKVMKDYRDASTELSNIEGAMSLGPNANIDTSLRKLQSIMRNNVSTNYGARTAMGETLNAKAGGTLMPELAGQALSANMPRGLGRLAASGELLGAGASAIAGSPATAAAMVPLLAASSPRLVGETAHALGRFGNPVQQGIVGGVGAANIGAALPRLLQLNPQLLPLLLRSQQTQPTQ